MSNTKKVLDMFGKQVVSLARKNLKSAKHKKYKTSNTGKLSKSLAYNLKVSKTAVGSFEFDISMEDYGELVDSGQLGSERKILKNWNKSLFIPRGKGFTSKPPPIDPIKRWAQQKGGKINPYAVRTKIWRKGIQPSLFLSDAWNKEYKDLPNELVEAFGLDVESFFKFANK